MTSHYPTSAELAAFRLWIRRAQHRSRVLHPESGAWLDEIDSGIGYTLNATAYRDAHDASRARKGAAALRRLHAEPDVDFSGHDYRIPHAQSEPCPTGCPLAA